MKTIELILNKNFCKSKVLINGEEINRVVSVSVSADVNDRVPCVIIKAIPNRIIIKGEVDDKTVEIGNYYA